jgi:alkanesulfonate monooxygenase SsuD/methylene tetrahydromethanopterin reductase-like flavin-dependent oxidoreductase (luciferase family)
VAREDAGVEFGVHLPVMDFGDTRFDLPQLLDFADAAADLGFEALAANDHLLFATPWLDGPTALVAVASRAASMQLATTVALPVVRGPVPLAKQLAAIDVLSNGRVVAGVGPGSSTADYAAVGIDFEERWPRFDESISVLRALWQEHAPPFVGRYYSTDGLRLTPRPARADGIPIWVGSWGSAAGLRRVARLGDGWIASAYNTTPVRFADAWQQLLGMLEADGRDGAAFPNAIATMWFHIADDRADAERVLRERLAPHVHRDVEELRARLAFGTAEEFVGKLRALAAAGVQRVYVWPVVDEVEQIDRFAREVRPAVA